MRYTKVKANMWDVSPKTSKSDIYKAVRVAFNSDTKYERKPFKGEKNGKLCPLWSPFLYTPDKDGKPNRRGENLIGMDNWFPLDFDDVDERIEGLYEYSCLLVSSPSCTVDNIKCRAYLKLDRALDDIKEIDMFLAGMKKFAVPLGADKCFDKARCVYMPYRHRDVYKDGEYYDKCDNWIDDTNVNKPIIRVDDIIAMCPAEVLTDTKVSEIVDFVDSVMGGDSCKITIKGDLNDFLERKIIEKGFDVDDHNKGGWLSFTGYCIWLVHNSQCSEDEIYTAWDNLCSGFSNYDRDNNTKTWNNLMRK